MLPARRLTTILLPFAALGMGVLVACEGQRARDVEIRFELRQGSSDDDVIIQDARVYVHGFELIGAGGQAHALRLSSASPWQNEQVALIDFIGSTEADRNLVVRGSAQMDVNEVRSLRFSVGVPFALNHANPLTAPSPLDRADMFWAWQTGYKFLRVDVAIGGHDSVFHLGSTGCSSASALRPPVSPCAEPNSTRVELAGFDPKYSVIRLNLAPLVAALRTSSGVACTGEYAQVAACAAAYATTGLNIDTGHCDDDACSSQSLFELAP